MQELVNIQPKGFEFINMKATPEQAGQILNSQVAMQGLFMMHMGDHLSQAIREMNNHLKEN